MRERESGNMAWSVGSHPWGGWLLGPHRMRAQATAAPFEGQTAETVGGMPAFMRRVPEFAKLRRLMLEACVVLLCCVVPLRHPIVLSQS